MTTSVTAAPRRWRAMVLMVATSALALTSFLAQPAAAGTEYDYTVGVRTDVPAGWFVDYAPGNSHCITLPGATTRKVPAQNDAFQVHIQVKTDGKCFTDIATGVISVSVREPDREKGFSPYSADYKIEQIGPHWLKMYCEYRSNVKCDGDSGFSSATGSIKPSR